MTRPVPPDPAPEHGSNQAPDSAGPDEDLLAEAAETFAILASPVRLHLLWLLARHPSDVTTLAETVGASTALVSQHLAKVRLADLVSARRKGKRQIYLLDDPHIVALVHQALDHHSELQAQAGRVEAQVGGQLRGARRLPRQPIRDPRPDCGDENP